MMRSLNRIVLSLLACALLAAPALAQNPTGTLSGHVTDGKDALPGVTVTVTSPSLQGTRTVVTEVTGDYIFKFLPAGDYRVRFELQGFQTIDTGLKVNAAQTQKVDATMPQAKVAEEVTVVGSYETISSSGTAATTLEKNLVDALPGTRDIPSISNLTAGVSASGPQSATVIAGAGSYDNLMMVNGVQLQDNVRGTLNNVYIEDAVQETTTSVSGVSAEYGRFTGGVINTLTKSGGNDFHASYRDTIRNDKWTSKTPITTAQPEDKLLNQHEATLGGYLFKDRLWFFVAGRDQKRSTARQTYVTNLPYINGLDEQRYEGKLTFSFNSNHRVIGSYTEFKHSDTGYGFRQSGYEVLDLANIYDRKTPMNMQAFNYTGVLTNNFFVEGQYSEKSFTFIGSGSRYTDLQRGTPLEDGNNFSNTGVYNSPLFCAVCPGAEEQRNNHDYLAKASWFLSTPRLGSHDVVIGVDRYEDIMMSNNWQSGSGYQLYVDGEVLNPDGLIRLDPNGTPYPVLSGTNRQAQVLYTPIFELTTGNNFRTDSLFINDKWRLNNSWSFNIGLRYDRNRGVNGSGVVVAKDSNVSPRVGVTYDPSGDGTWQFNASYAKYTASISNAVGNNSSAAGSPASIYYAYAGPDINTDPTQPLVSAHDAITQVFAWFNALTQAQKAELLNQAQVPGVNVKIRGSLDSPNTDEFALGATVRLGTNGIARLDYVNRKFHNFFTNRIDTTTGQVDDMFGNVYDLQLVENRESGISREYNGLLLSVSYKLTKALSLGGNYTWSTLKGNMVGESGGSGPLPFGGISYERATIYKYPEYQDPKWNNPEGYLPSDQQHRLRLWGVWDVLSTKHHRLSVSAMQFFNTGIPYGARGDIAIRSYVTNPGYASPPSRVSYYFTSRDAYRTDNIYSTDLSFTYSFVVPAFGTNLELFVTPRVTNAFNQHGVINVNTSVYTSRDAGKGLSPFNPFTTSKPIECPQGASADSCSQMGATWQKAATFGTPLNPTTPAGYPFTVNGDYQMPRTFLLSLGVRF
jgi:outer membrane receptor protein involved in Fe transport